jgi:hypothetical protein
MKNFNRLVLSASTLLSSLVFMAGIARGQSVPFTIGLYYPTTNQTFGAPASIYVHARVTDSNLIQTVQYFSGTTSIGLVTNSGGLWLTNTTQSNPFFITWSNGVASGAGGAITFNGSLTDGKGTLNFADLWTGGAVPAFPGLPVNQTEKVAGLTAAATGGNKIYNGTTTAMVTLADHQVFGGAVADSYPRASFGWQNFVDGHPVSVSGNSISGPAAGNYNFQNLLHNRTASTSASLPALAVTWTGSGAYDWPTAAAANLTLGNNFNGVNLTLPGSVPLAVKNAGSPMIPAVALGGSAPVSRAQETGAATWSFDSGAAQNNNTAAYTGTVPYAANTLNTAVFSDGTIQHQQESTQGGTVGVGAGDSSTVALQFSSGPAGPATVNGADFVLSLRVAALISINSINITYNYLATTGTPAAINTWRLNASGSPTATASTTQNGAWNTATVTFSGLNLAGGSSFTLTDTLSGYTNAPGGGGIAEFDNISLDTNVVPEPGSVALVIFGALLGGLGRLYAAKRRSVLQPQA